MAIFDRMKVQLKLLGWMVVTGSFSIVGKEVIIMEQCLEFLREVLRGITRAISAHFFQKTFLDKKKATPRRSKQKGGSRNKI